MPYAMRSITCATCGREMHGKYPKGKKCRCWECGVAASREAQLAQHRREHWSTPLTLAYGEAVRRQIEARSGPLYDRWIAGQARALARHIPDFPPE